MKRFPLLFRLDNGEGYGFTPFRDAANNWVYKRDVFLKPFIWTSGAGVTFSIIEYYSSLELGLKEKELVQHTFYDKDYPAQAIDMMNLASGDLRGDGAEMTAHHLYWTLFLPTDEMREFLPKLYEFYQSVMEKSKENQ